MVLKATLQKESPNQSHPKVSSEAGVYADVLQNRSSRNFPIFTGKHLCWSLFFNKLYWKRLQHVFSCEYCEIFDSKPPVASADLLYLIKSNVGWFLLKRVDLVTVRVICTLLVETILTGFHWLTCRNQKLVQNKPLQQRLFDLISGFWQS